jgi:hypothetical protein
MLSIDDCIKDALRRLTPQHFANGQANTSINDKECEIHVWPQTWPDASCGSGMGFSAQVITQSPTVVVIGPMGDACVYHGGDFAYHIEETNERFWSCIDDRCMPSKEEHERRQHNVGI